MHTVFLNYPEGIVVSCQAIMKNRFSIGEMSKLHNTPIKTLRYYDELDLFKPIEVDKKNGYRYYSTEQFEQLNTINYLKFLGIPLKEIKEHFEKRNINNFLGLLRKQKEITEKKINELELIKNRFVNRVNEIIETKNIKDIEKVVIKTIPERKILRLKERINSQSELELTLRKLENIANKASTIIIGRVGLSVSKDNIKKNIFDEYNSIFILLEEDSINNQLADIFESADYACLYYRGEDHSKSPKYYKMILDYLDKNEYEIIGDSIERVIIDSFISDNEDDYLTEIQIPIKKY